MRRENRDFEGCEFVEWLCVHVRILVYARQVVQYICVFYCSDVRALVRTQPLRVSSDMHSPLISGAGPEKRVQSRKAICA